MSALLRALQRRQPQGVVGFGVVRAYLGGGRYLVEVGGTRYEVRAPEGVQAAEGQGVAVTLEGGRPVALLGPVHR